LGARFGPGSGSEDGRCPLYKEQLMSNENKYRDELNLLIKLRDERLAMAETDVERAAAGPQLIAFSKQIQSLNEKCIQYDLRLSTTLEKGTLESFALNVVQIVKQEMADVPEYTEWRQRAVDIFCKLKPENHAVAPYVADVIEQLTETAPDKVSVACNIASRIVELVAEMANEQAADSD
jgi:hypothetical protein